MLEFFSSQEIMYGLSLNFYYSTASKKVINSYKIPCSNNPNKLFDLSWINVLTANNAEI